MIEVGKRIKNLRTSKGLKQEDIAKIIKKSIPTVASIEKGEHKGTFEIIIKISNALGVSADYILGIEKKEKANYNVSEEGEKLIEDYIKYIQEKYPKEHLEVEKNYTKAGNL